MNPIAAAGQLSDEEILKVWCQGWDTGEAWGAIKFARALIAADRSRRAAAPPEGEVAELAADRLRIVAAGIRYGYMAGHNDTVEGCYGDPDELAADEAPAILEELDAASAPAGEVE